MHAALAVGKERKGEERRGHICMDDGWMEMTRQKGETEESTDM